MIWLTSGGISIIISGLVIAVFSSFSQKSNQKEVEAASSSKGREILFAFYYSHHFFIVYVIDDPGANYVSVDAQ